VAVSDDAGQGPDWCSQLQVLFFIFYFFEISIYFVVFCAGIVYLYNALEKNLLLQELSKWLWPMGGNLGI